MVGLAFWTMDGNALDPALEADAVSWLRDNYRIFLGYAIDTPAVLRFLLREEVLPEESANALLRRAVRRDNPEINALLLQYMQRFHTPEGEEARARKLLLEEDAPPWSPPGPAD